MIKLKLFRAKDVPKPDIPLKTLRCNLCRKPILHMTADQTIKRLQIPKTGVPKDVSGLVVTCPCCGSMYIFTAITDTVKPVSTLS